MVSFTYPARTKKLLILLKKIKIPQAKKSVAIAKAKHEKSVFLKRPDPRWAVYLKSSKKGGPKTIQESPRKQSCLCPNEITINPSPECPTFSDFFFPSLIFSPTKSYQNKSFAESFFAFVLGSANSRIVSVWIVSLSSV